MPVILLCGFKGSGKDLVGEFFKKFANEEKIDFHLLSFADKIKECLKKTFRLKTDCDYDLFKRSDMVLMNDFFQKKLNGRDVLRAIGMSMRECNEDFFLNSTISEIEKHPESLNVITDLRFKNELDWAIKNKHIIIKIERNGSISDGHISELGIDTNYCNYVIDNNGTEHELKQKVRKIFFEIIDKENNGKKS